MRLGSFDDASTDIISRDAVFQHVAGESVRSPAEGKLQTARAGNQASQAGDDGVMKDGDPDEDAQQSAAAETDGSRKRPFLAALQRLHSIRFSGQLSRLLFAGLFKEAATLDAAAQQERAIPLGGTFPAAEVTGLAFQRARHDRTPQ